MNWEAIGAIGEVFGAIAVLATLIYFSIQIRNMQAASIADAFSRSEEGDRALTSLYISHIALLIKANRGEVLSEEEHSILKKIYWSHQSHYFHQFGKSKVLGSNGDIAGHNFAVVLKENPCFLPMFEEQGFTETSGISKAFGTAVQRMLNEEGV